MRSKQILKMKISNVKSRWVALLNVSLKFDDDVIADGIFRPNLQIKYLEILSSENTNPPNNSMIATSFTNGMSSERRKSREVGRTSFLLS